MAAHMISLKYDNFRFYWAVVTEKRLKSVFAKISYLCAGILNDKSVFSPVIEIFQKIPINR